jgi:hypothetical protein
MWYMKPGQGVHKIIILFLLSEIKKKYCINIFNSLHTLFMCNNGIRQCRFCSVKFLLYISPNHSFIVITARIIIVFVMNSYINFKRFLEFEYFLLCNYSSCKFYDQLCLSGLELEILLGSGSAELARLYKGVCRTRKIEKK